MGIFQKIIVNRINSELSNDYGNLIQRVLSMLQKYKEGVVPELGSTNEVEVTFKYARKYI